MIEELQDRTNADPFIRLANFVGSGHRFEIANRNAGEVAVEISGRPAH
jgi:hypothetical protein